MFDGYYSPYSVNVLFDHQRKLLLDPLSYEEHTLMTWGQQPWLTVVPVMLCDDARTPCVCGKGPTQESAIRWYTFYNTTDPLYLPSERAGECARDHSKNS